METNLHDHGDQTICRDEALIKTEVKEEELQIKEEVMYNNDGGECESPYNCSSHEVKQDPHGAPTQAPTGGPLEPRAACCSCADVTAHA